MALASIFSQPGLSSHFLNSVFSAGQKFLILMKPSYQLFISQIIFSAVTKNSLPNLKSSIFTSVIF